MQQVGNHCGHDEGQDSPCLRRSNQRSHRAYYTTVGVSGRQFPLQLRPPELVLSLLASRQAARQFWGGEATPSPRLSSPPLSTIPAPRSSPCHSERIKACTEPAEASV